MPYFLFSCHARRLHTHPRAGLLPKPPGLNLWGKKPLDEGLDTAKRFLHVTSAALVLEVEGDDEVRSGYT